MASLLKHIIYTLAHALHSNRTLIFAARMPYLFERTQSVWLQSGVFQQSNMSLECNSREQLFSGPYSCMFQPLSSCTLADATPQEIVTFSHDAFNPQSRLLLTNFEQTVRNSISLNMPPRGMLRTVAAALGVPVPRIRAGGAQMFVAACTAYVFRLKPDVVRQFQPRMSRLFADSRAGTKWGIHVRHGDVKVRRKTHGHKMVFDFESYFGAARDFSHLVQTVPSTVYVATDSTDIGQVPQRWLHFLNNAAVPFASQEPFSPWHPRFFQWWQHDRVPSIDLVIENNRYRTKFGHNPAAGAACMRDEEGKDGVCSMQPEEVAWFDAQPDHSSVPKAHRLMRVWLEAIEEIYVLSNMDVV